jgi:hypothetical protein
VGVAGEVGSISWGPEWAAGESATLRGPRGVSRAIEFPVPGQRSLANFRQVALVVGLPNKLNPSV